MKTTLTRSNRKTCSIIIRDNTVEVRAPLRMPQQDIDRFVKSKEEWITAKLAESVSRMEQRAGFSLNYNDTVRYRGGTFPIIAKPGFRAGLSEEGFYMPPGLTLEQIKYACVQIYRLCAKSVLKEKVFAFAGAMGVSPAAVKINGAQTRWGSCSGKKSLNFSWRLMMADDPVIDYVVVHELAHIKEMNHSPRFWAVVGQVMPDYRARQKELRGLQKQLCTEEWE